MTNQSPITPPRELVQQWMDLPIIGEERLAVAYRAGADAELEACCDSLRICGWHSAAEELRLARGPKQSSLKKRAIALINSCTDPDGDYLDDNALTTIRRALEQLPDEQ